MFLGYSGILHQSIGILGHAIVLRIPNSYIRSRDLHLTNSWYYLMQKSLIATFMILLSALVTISALPLANASTSLLCITPVGTKCSTRASVQFTGTVGSTLTIWVAIHSKLINGFDIIVIANHNFLSPQSASSSTGIFGPSGSHPGSVFKYCVADVDLIGGGCSPADNLDTIHLGLASVGTGLTGHHTVGQLFSITYTIAAIPSSPIPIQFQTGCATTSIAGTTDCALITNGSASPSPIDVALTATFV